MNNDKDQDWLDALAGKPNVDADPDVTRHASALRQAIQQHDAALDLSEVDTEENLQKLKFRLRREGLIEIEQRPATEPRIKGGWFGQVFSGSGFSLALNRRFVQFAIAASVVLTVGLMMRTHLHQEPLQNESEIMRGLGDRQIVLAADPEERLRQLTAELDQLGIKYQVARKVDEILLKIQGVDPVKEDVESFLERNYIKPPVRDSLELDIRPIPKP